VPFFDRPRPPRDWRWAVGNVGRMFITLGLLMFAFVGYQLWGTGIKTAQAQDDLEQQFIELLEGASTSTTAVPDTTAPGDIVTSTTVPVAPATRIELGAPVARLRIERIGLDPTARRSTASTSSSRATRSSPPHRRGRSPTRSAPHRTARGAAGSW